MSLTLSCVVTMCHDGVVYCSCVYLCLVLLCNAARCSQLRSYCMMHGHSDRHQYLVRPLSCVRLVGVCTLLLVSMIVL